MTATTETPAIEVHTRHVSDTGGSWTGDPEARPAVGDRITVTGRGGSRVATVTSVETPMASRPRYHYLGWTAEGEAEAETPAPAKVVTLPTVAARTEGEPRKIKPSLATVRRAIKAGGPIHRTGSDGVEYTIDSIRTIDGGWVWGETWDADGNGRWRGAFSRAAKIALTREALRILGDDDGATARAAHERRVKAAMER